MINIYTNQSYLTQEYRRCVFPLLFDLCYLNSNLMKEHFLLVNDIKLANIAILPVDLCYYYNQKKQTEVDTFIKIAQQYNIPVWIYSGGDFGISLNQPNVTVFRFGGFHSKMSANMQVMPSFISDPYGLVLSADFHFLPKQKRPTIGFVGNADGSVEKWIKELLIYTKQSIFKLVDKDQTDLQSFFPSSGKRDRCLKELEKTSGINTDFIYRNKYRAGAINLEMKEKSTHEFYENIERNLYTFCLRGRGNFSVRFYETLIMGRIPLLINTDVRLPLQDEINWNRHCIIARADDFKERLLLFHATHTNEEIINIQQQNRALALNLLSRENYFIHMGKKQIN